MSNSISQLIDRALSYHRKGQFIEAEKYYEEALKLQKNNSIALHYLGVIRHQQGKNIEAEELINRALSITPDDIMAMSNLGVTYSALNKFEEAEKLFSEVLLKQPKNFQVLANRGNAYQSLKQFEKAIADYRRALKLNPRLYEAARNLGQCLQDTGQLNAAKQILEYCIHLAPHFPQAYISMANFYRTTFQLEAAKSQYEKALELAPSVPEIHCDLAITLRDLGELSGAESHFEKATELKPELGRAWRGLAGLKTYTELPEILSMKAALENTEDINAKMHLNFALGKAQEDIGNFKEAFSHFNSANLTQANLADYDVAIDLKFFKNLQSTFNQKFLESYMGEGSDSNQPIFVLGMPRSGTSLVEQILASHSKVFGAGELSVMASEINRAFPPFDDQDYTNSLKQARADDFNTIGKAYLKALASITNSNADYIVDKMPMNFMHVGVIALALPNAKIIHCTRDPMDNCLSIFKNHLPASGHHYSTQLKTLGQYYKGYSRLMEHWKRICKNLIFDIEYESLVKNPEEETRLLLKACGLTFEKACLTPHMTKRRVSTLSAAQVRNPINRKSVGKWREYEAHLQELQNEIFSK